MNADELLKLAETHGWSIRSISRDRVPSQRRTANGVFSRTMPTRPIFSFFLWSGVMRDRAKGDAAKQAASDFLRFGPDALRQLKRDRDALAARILALEAAAQVATSPNPGSFAVPPTTPPAPGTVQVTAHAAMIDGQSRFDGPLGFDLYSDEKGGYLAAAVGAKLLSSWKKVSRIHKRAGVWVETAYRKDGSLAQ